MTPPVPPAELLARIGEESAESYLGAGSAIRTQLDALLGEEWSWEGKRVLDFGCGCGRLLGRLRDEPATLSGVDIDEPSIAWVTANLGVDARTIGEAPPLPFEDGSYDLVVAVSVITHLTDLWAEWLLDLHRVLAPGGLLVASFFSEAYAPVLLPDTEWDADRVGMLALGYGAPWSAGGPMVLFSEWWLRAHWGRAFDVEQLRTSGFAAPADAPSQGVAVLRRRDVALSPEDLRAAEPGEPRELAALETALAQTQRERAELNRAHDEYAEAYAAARRELDARRGGVVGRLRRQ
jgi:SAM-dependent methyltransferase